MIMIVNTKKLFAFGNIVSALVAQVIHVPNAEPSGYTGANLVGQDLRSAADEYSLQNMTNTGFSSIEKRDVNIEVLEKVMDFLEDTVVEFGLTDLLDEDILPSILKEVKERTLHFAIGVMHHVASAHYIHEANVAYCSKYSVDNSPATKILQGGNIGGAHNYPQNYTLFSLVGKKNDSPISTTDLWEICQEIYNSAIEEYGLLEPSELTPKMLAQKMHVKIPKELDSKSFHMMIAIITPENEVQVFNFGTSWAGLYRDGNLIAHTVLQKRQDSSYQYGNSAKPAETIWDVSEHKWQAQPGDLFIVLSDEVRNMLNPARLRESFSLIKTLGPMAQPFLKEKDFDLYAMVIVKAARIAAGEQPNNDMFASVIRIGKERDS